MGRCKEPRDMREMNDQHKMKDSGETQPFATFGTPFVCGNS